jgi:hypothetical protein
VVIYCSLPKNWTEPHSLDWSGMARSQDDLMGTTTQCTAYFWGVSTPVLLSTAVSRGASEGCALAPAQDTPPRARTTYYPGDAGGERRRGHR